MTNEINKYKKLLSSAEAELKKLESSSQSAAGYTIFSACKVVSTNPLIVYNNNFLCGPIGYSCITNASVDFWSTSMGWSGYAKPTGEYVYYNGSSVAVYRAEKIQTNSLKILQTKENIKSYKSWLSYYTERNNAAKKAKIGIGGDDDYIYSKASKTVKLGEKKYTVDYYFSQPYYFSDKIKWKSSNTNVATVKSNGTVNLKKPGKTTITATYSPTNTKITLSLTVVDIVDNILLSSNEVSLKLNGQKTLKANVTPSGTKQSVKWVSSDESVVTVSNGKITAVGTGTAYVYAYVKPKNKLNRVVSAPFKVVVTGKSETLSAAAAPADAIAIVRQLGIVEGDAFFEAKSAGGYYSVKVSPLTEYVFTEYGCYNYEYSSSVYYVKKSTGAVYIKADGKMTKISAETSEE